MSDKMLSRRDFLKMSSAAGAVVASQFGTQAAHQVNAGEHGYLDVRFTFSAVLSAAYPSRETCY